MMWKNSENDHVDLKPLRSLGKFDAAYFLPTIARLSNTFLEPLKEKSDEVFPL